jgi:hypothetical protein
MRNLPWETAGWDVKITASTAEFNTSNTEWTGSSEELGRGRGGEDCEDGCLEHFEGWFLKD